MQEERRRQRGQILRTERHSLLGIQKHTHSSPGPSAFSSADLERRAEAQGSGVSKSLPKRRSAQPWTGLKHRRSHCGTAQMHRGSSGAQCPSSEPTGQEGDHDLPCFTLYLLKAQLMVSAGRASSHRQLRAGHVPVT